MADAIKVAIQKHVDVLTHQTMTLMNPQVPFQQQHQVAIQNAQVIAVLSEAFNRLNAPQPMQYNPPQPPKEIFNEAEQRILTLHGRGLLTAKQAAQHFGLDEVDDYPAPPVDADEPPYAMEIGDRIEDLLGADDDEEVTDKFKQVTKR